MAPAMKVLCVLSIVLGAALTQQLDSTANDAEKKKISLNKLSTSALNFTRDLYSELSASPGNVIFSPLSIHSILSMTSLGARSHTAEQMRRVLHLLDTTNPTCLCAYKQVYRHFNSMKAHNVAVDIANKIYVKKAVTLNEEFLKESRETFQAEAEVVDFTAADAADRINSWVENKTHHKIKDLFNRGDLDGDTVMVLVNAIYFKATWQKQFEDSITFPRPFHLADGSTRDVRMMEDRTTHRYKEAVDSHTQVLELPYRDSDVSMIVLLPSVDRSLQDLESEIKEKGLQSFADNLEEVLLQVFLPKFRVEKKVELTATLRKLGMSEIFDNGADFSGLVANGAPLKVSQVVHKAFIDVSEKGTEAAAATGVGFSAVSAFSFRGPPPAIVFKADRPFVFAIYHKTSKQVMFMGRYAVPEISDI